MSKNIISQPRWKRVEYSKGEIERAGKVVCDSSSTDEERHLAIKIIDNWRAAHAYPLQIFYNHLRRSAHNNDNIIVVQRLKRLDSILQKIERTPEMSLWRMQDLGDAG